MDEDKIIKILKEFSGIKPSADFIGRSRPLVLSARRNRPAVFGRFFEALKVKPAFALAVLLFLAVAGFAYSRISVTMSTSDSDNLLVEAADLNIDIHLNEAEYFDESIKEVATVLENVSKQSGDSTDKTDIDNQELNKQNTSEKAVL